MILMFGIFRLFHVHIDLERKEFLWRSVLEYMYLSFNGWCACVAAYGVNWGIHWAGTSNRPLIILKSRVSLAIFLRSSNLVHPILVSISVTLYHDHMVVYAMACLVQNVYSAMSNHFNFIDVGQVVRVPDGWTILNGRE